MKILIYLVLAVLLCWITACKRISEDLDNDPARGFTFHDPLESANWQNDSLVSDFERNLAYISVQKEYAEKQRLVDSLLAALKINGIPCIEQEILAHFIYQDSANGRVEITGDFNNWSENGTAMSRLEGTNLYFYSARFPASARIEYKLRTNGIRMNDPLNPNSSCYGDFSRNSELRMPFYMSPPEIEYYEIPHGLIKVLQYYDTNRRIQVYLPPGYIENAGVYPCAYFHDGNSFLQIGMAKNILDYLIYHKKIKPVIAVFVDPVNRDNEYYYGYEYMETFVNRIVPYVEKNFRVDHESKNRSILGYSLGGLSALLFARHHPDVFGNCAAFSPAIFTGDIIQSYRESPYLSTRFYIDAGTYENWIYTPSRELATLMAHKKFVGRFYSWHEYHSICSWRAHLDEALCFFYGA